MNAIACPPFAPTRARRHRRVRGRGGGVGVERGDGGGAVRACSGRRCRGTGSSRRRCPTPGAARGVHQQVPVRERAAGVGVSPSRPASCLLGPHRDQRAAGVDPVGEHRDLVRGERHLAEDDDVEGVERVRRDDARCPSR